MFHLELTEPTSERWISQEDHDGESTPAYFECFWVRWSPRVSSSPAWELCSDASPTSHARMATTGGAGKRTSARVAAVRQAAVTR